MIKTLKLLIIMGIQLLSLSWGHVLVAEDTRASMITELGTSADMIGIGAVEGFTQGASVLFENPASLSQLDGISASLFSSNILNELAYSAVSISKPFYKGRLGLGFVTVADHDFAHTVIDPNDNDRFTEKSSFGYKESLYKLGYAQVHSNLILGTGLLVYTKDTWAVKGRGFNFDAGVLYKTPQFEGSLTVKNIIPGFKINYKIDEDYIDSDGSILLASESYAKHEIIPMQLVGAAKKSLGLVDLFAQAKAYNKQLLLSFATIYRPTFLPYGQVSWGYREFLADDKVKRSIVLGFGVTLVGVNFQYAFESSEHISVNHKSYFSLNIKI